MNPEYEEKLAAEIERELKALPELKAPSTLLRRVMKTRRLVRSADGQRSSQAGA